MTAVLNSPLARADLEAAPPGRGIYLICFLTLALGLVISIGSFVWVRNGTLNDARLRFERQASDAHHNIEARIKSYTDIVYGLRALLYSSDRITRRQFHNYVEGLDLRRRFPGFFNLNYAAHVQHEAKARFEQSVRGDTSMDPAGYPNFSIRPPGDRSYYHVLIYLEPMVESSFGRDVTADPKIRQLFEQRIHASDELASSGRPPLIGGRSPFWAIAMRLPIYRQDVEARSVDEKKAALVGTLGAGFRVDELLQNVLDKETLETLHFQVYEAGSADPSDEKEGRLLLFDSATPQAAPGTPARALSDEYEFSTALPLTIAGRIWEIQYGARGDTLIKGGAAAQPWLVLFGGVLISLLLFGIAYSLASSRSRAVALAREITRDLRQSEAELRASSETLKAVSRRLLEVQEAERRSLAGELHDRVGANLSALSVNLNLIAAYTDQSNPKIAGHFEDSVLLLEETADAIRNVMGELRPLSIDEYGLLAPLRAIAARIEQRSGTKVTVDGPGPAVRAPRPVELAMFRIAQEALNNIGKYAKAENVRIHYAGEQRAAVLTIEDDGIGFDVTRIEGPKPDSGWGLLIMRERAEAAGATFNVDSQPGRGTKVTIAYRG